jgi:hypothetical protein
MKIGEIETKFEIGDVVVRGEEIREGFLRPVKINGIRVVIETTGGDNEFETRVVYSSVGVNHVRELREDEILGVKEASARLKMKIDQL